MRIDKKKRKESRNNTITPLFQNRFDNGPHIEDFWSTLSL